MCRNNPIQSKNGLVVTPAQRTEDRSEATKTMLATPEPTAHTVRTSHAMRITHRGAIIYSTRINAYLSLFQNF